jgi:hypothetical protein
MIQFKVGDFVLCIKNTGIGEDTFMPGRIYRVEHRASIGHQGPAVYWNSDSDIGRLINVDIINKCFKLISKEDDLPELAKLLYEV